jgi:hypothetical protein
MPEYTEQFISPSGISELNSATTNIDIAVGRESLQVLFGVIGVFAGFTARGQS